MHSLLLTFNIHLSFHQLHDFRTAICELEGTGNDLFHNHDKNGKPIHRYPLIQYRCMQGKAGIFAINEGADAVEKLLRKKSPHINLYDHHMPLQVIRQEKERDFKLTLHRGKQRTFYRLFRWCPLDEKYFPSADATNHTKKVVQPWNCMFMNEKIKALESILVSNTIAFAQAVDWRISNNKALRVQIFDIHHVNDHVKLYGHPTKSFDITYATNAVLPDHLALGRGVSMGLGWQLQSEHNESLQALLSVKKKAAIVL